MGVIYKLKNNVVEFIVGQKKTNESFSCRGLTGIIKEKFQIDISKSSINNVLKQENLSSPVGRRPKPGSKPKIFRIPKNKKEQLFIDAPLMANPVIFLEQKPQEIASPVSQEEPGVIVTPENTGVPLNPAQTEDSSKAVWEPDPDFFTDTPGVILPGENKEIWDGMGCFFLKAAEWDLANSSILGHFIRQHSAVIAEDHDKIAGTILYHELFGIPGPLEFDLYEGAGLWELNNLDRKISTKEVMTMITNAIMTNEQVALFKDHCDELFSEISYFKLTCADTVDIYIDAHLQSLWLEHHILPNMKWPMNKALNILSANFISNTHPIIINNLFGLRDSLEGFYGFIRALENDINKQIKKITIYNSAKAEVARFTIIPTKKREFIIGVWPGNFIFQEIARQDTGKLFAFHSEDIPGTLWCSEITAALPITVNQKNGVLRAAFIRESESAPPILGILTNISQSKTHMQDVVRSFFERWPNAARHGQDSGEPVVPGGENKIFKDQALLLSEALLNSKYASVDLSLLKKALLESLSRYCQEHYFPISCADMDFSAMHEHFYKLSGFVSKIMNKQVVTLVIPRGYSHRSDLTYAVRHVNEGNITNYDAEKLMMRIKEA